MLTFSVELIGAGLDEKRSSSLRSHDEALILCSFECSCKAFGAVITEDNGCSAGAADEWFFLAGLTAGGKPLKRRADESRRFRFFLHFLVRISRLFFREREAPLCTRRLPFFMRARSLRRLRTAATFIPLLIASITIAMVFNFARKEQARGNFPQMWMIGKHMHVRQRQTSVPCSDLIFNKWIPKMKRLTNWQTTLPVRCRILYNFSKSCRIDHQCS